MPLAELTVVPDPEPLPRDVRAFLREADRRIERFFDGGGTPAFVPSDFDGAYRVLRAVAHGALARGGRFCEWGSGFGVVAGLAALLEFDASGIEIEAELADEARRLAADFDLPVEFARGSFVPRGAERRVYTGGEYAWLTTEGDYAYEELDLGPEDFDVIFAYPWPDEEAVTAGLFERYAGTGALLVTFHGGNGFRVRRKVVSRSRSRPRR